MALPEMPGPEIDVERRARYEREELLAISRALSSERDIRKLLDLILLKSRQITGADAGSVYVVEPADGEAPAGAATDGARWRSRAAQRDGRGQAEGDQGIPGRAGQAKRAAARLHFMLSQNDSMAVNFRELILPVDESSIAGKAVLSRRPINIASLGTLAAADAPGLFHNRSFDEQTGYQAHSMLTVPMLSAVGDVIGVIQLINKKRDPLAKLAGEKDFADQVVPFDARAEEMALALASQAGVSLENAILYDEIRRLFESFVDASVTAIEARDPTTSGHSRRVATLTVALAEKVDALGEGPLASVHFSRDDLRQIEYAGVLHDFGKVGVREQVLVKARKLYDWQLEAIGQRFRYLGKSLEAQALSRKLALFEKGERAGTPAFLCIDAELAEQTAFLDQGWRSVLAANQPSVMEEPVLARLRDLAAGSYLDENGAKQPYLTEEELTALEVPRGSLTADERLQIQSHVDHTIAFLRTIPWGRSLRNVPSIAGAHHELLDGTGYPRRLRGEDIPIESRMLTIADIFDALTASDRPYKAAVPIARALDIVASEVKAGKCDADLFRLFVDAEVYKVVLT
jgi:HD-GYP domain-containing protein (c-di-GMP phosphodiesterase class II)